MIPRLTRQTWLQLEWKRNVLQLITGVAFSIFGAAFGFSATDDLQSLAAALGGFIGFTVGVAITGFGLMIYDSYSRPTIRIPNCPMRGFDHLELQRKRAVWLTYCLLIATLSSFSLAFVLHGAFLLLFVACLTSIPLLAWLTRPRCPTCSTTLGLSWNGSFGRYCKWCGVDFDASPQET